MQYIDIFQYLSYFQQTDLTTHQHVHSKAHTHQGIYTSVIQFVLKSSKVVCKITGCYNDLSS